MSWLFLTFVSVVFRSIYGVMTKVLSNQVKTSAYTQAVLLTLAGGVLALFLSPILGAPHINFSKVSLGAISLVVFGQGLGNVTYFAAIKKLTNGTAQIAFSSILIFNTLLALIFLGLHLDVANVFGIVLLLLAIVSVASGKVEFEPRGIALMLISAFFFSVFQLASAEVSKDINPTTYLLVAYFGAALVVFLCKPSAVLHDLNKHPIKRTITIPALTALPSLGNFLFAYYAYREAPEPAKVAMLLTAQVVLTVLLSYFFLKEKGNILRKVTAALLVLVSAVMIKG